MSIKVILPEVASPKAPEFPCLVKLLRGVILYVTSETECVCVKAGSGWKLGEYSNSNSNSSLSWVGFSRAVADAGKVLSREEAEKLGLAGLLPPAPEEPKLSKAYFGYADRAYYRSFAEPAFAQAIGYNDLSKDGAGGGLINIEEPALYDDELIRALPIGTKIEITVDE